jgi:hypothetical protein
MGATACGGVGGWAVGNGVELSAARRRKVFTTEA